MVAGEPTVLEQNRKQAMLLPYEGEIADFAADPAIDPLWRDQMQAPVTNQPQRIGRRCAGPSAQEEGNCQIADRIKATSLVSCFRLGTWFTLT